MCVARAIPPGPERDVGARPQGESHDEIVSGSGISHGQTSNVLHRARKNGSLFGAEMAFISSASANDALL